MYELIVLGLIPGTHIQINFSDWQHFVSGITIVVILWRVHRLHIVRNAIISFALLRHSKRATVAMV